MAEPNLPNPSSLEASEPARLRRRLERAEQLFDCYQKALGHELPNQLVAIQGLLRVLELEERDRLSPDSRDYLNRLGALARRAHGLARALAELGRAARDDQPAEPICLAEAAREAAAEINLLCPGLRIEYDFPVSAPTLTVARPGLRQVLLQLLRNAARAVSPDGPACVQIGARRTEARIEFWVADNGRGLSQEQQQHLFEPFGPRDRPDGENGLGLFLVRHIVESWNGAVHVRSELGRGSTFTITVEPS